MKTPTQQETAQELVDLLRQGHCKEYYARNSMGNPENPSSEKAVSWCILGGIKRLREAAYTDYEKNTLDRIYPAVSDNCDKLEQSLTAYLFSPEGKKELKIEKWETNSITGFNDRNTSSTVISTLEKVWHLTKGETAQ